jgi:hypothetical protein
MVFLEALKKIVGVTPAFMRPRAFTHSHRYYYLINFSQAYGNYNNLVRQASYIRGQKLVTWDFEYVFLISK